MKKATKNQIIRWHENGFAVDEFAPLVPQCCRQEIEAVIKGYEEAKRWKRLTGRSSS